MRRFVPKIAFAVLSPLAVAMVASMASAEPSDAELSKRISDLEHDAAHRSELSVPLENAKRALARSHHDAKGAPWAPQNGATDRHAALLRALAGQWLDVARDLVRTVDAEKGANLALKALDEAQTKIVRGRLLLEETIARRGRTQAQLDALDKPSPPPALPPANPAPTKKPETPHPEPRK